MSDELNAAQRDLERAIEVYARLLGAEGVIGEWTTVVAFQSFGPEPEDSATQIVNMLPDHVPYHRSLGLLEYALIRTRRNIERLDHGDDD